MSKFDFNDGKAHAIRIITDAVQYPSMFYKGTGLEDVIANLESALEARPKDYADGVRSVIKQVNDLLQKRDKVTH